MIFTVQTPEATVDDLAAALLRARRVAAGYSRALLTKMLADNVKRVNVPGLGHVVYVRGSTSTPVDGAACALKVGALGARLRELGAQNVDDAIPLGVSNRSAHVRATLQGEQEAEP